MKFAIQNWRITAELAVLTANAVGCVVFVLLSLVYDRRASTSKELPIPLTEPSTGPMPVVLKVVGVMGAAFSGFTMDPFFMRLSFSIPTIQW